MTQDQLDNWFSYHAPEGDDLERYAKLRSAGKVFAETINECCPESADKTAAVRKVREAVMTANASIACRGK
ncbi:hypothetical protein ACFPT7_02255 [Acidicapsa dinghuensis]|uniref:Acb2/Tad1 hairpin domain-containing protein n=1 Tax=Acidicapsa dinghuensis TaxID=2218256 RepID=A0ABW1EAM1_9BACT|nr:hypothetical protein [Acidicapsa dinghuensis]